MHETPPARLEATLSECGLRYLRLIKIVVTNLRLHSCFPGEL